jgi:hypothetical protein
MLMGTAKISDYQETNAKIPIVESKAVKFQQMSASLPKKKMVWAKKLSGARTSIN